MTRRGAVRPRLIVPMVSTLEASMGKQWDSFDVQTASTVYWKEVPVLSRMPDREEHKADLTIRIMTGVNRNNHNARVSSASRPLF